MMENKEEEKEKSTIGSETGIEINEKCSSYKDSGQSC